MKKYQFKKMFIAAPCHEDWNKMTPLVEGRHCASCKETIYDFTQMNEEQYNAFMQQKGKQVCGKFRPDQLNQEYRFQAKALPNKWQRMLQYSRSLAAVLLIKIGIISSAQAINYKTPTEWVTKKQTPTKGGDQIVGKITNASSKNSPIQGATVKLKLKGKVIMETTTDSHGRYIFELDSKYDRSLTYWVEASKEKYKSKSRTVKYTTVSIAVNAKNIHETNILMPVKVKVKYKEQHIMGKVAPISY